VFRNPSIRDCDDSGQVKKLHFLERTSGRNFMEVVGLSAERTQSLNNCKHSGTSD
jgi:hypothetical protein